VSTTLRVLVATDAFPPICGGSGWSTWELVRGLAARGHDVDVVKVEIAPDAGVVEQRYETIPVTTFRAQASTLPVVRNVAKNERLWKTFADFLTDRLASQPVDIIHAQHVMTTVPAIRAGASAATPVVATVRDYWPVCYWSTLIYDPSQPALCPACSVGMMQKCVRPRAGGFSVAAWPLIPYMRSNLATKRATLARASAIIAVSSPLARDLRARAPELATTPIFTIPNPVDMAPLDLIRGSAGRPAAGPYVLYAGKLATNKGVQFLLPALAQAGVDWPLVIAGDGPLRGDLEAEARASGRDMRVLGWLDRGQVWTWMRHATMLAFPSYGPESLSRVLIEAAALGVPIAAMNTGGTTDILQHRVSGLLSDDAAGFARDLGALAGDERLRSALGAAARAAAHTRFSAASVVERVEQVYRHVLMPEAA
jgi:glycosyltransferase involved in cell wall biosynthesis